MFDKRKKRRKRKSRRSTTVGALTSATAAIEKFVVEEIELGGVLDSPAPPSVRKKVSSNSQTGVKQVAGTLGLWLLLFLATLFARSPWPVEETRVLGIAWEMWSAGDFLLPRLNGEIVPHAPLLYWLIQLGWSALGVSEWWGRLVPALFSLASLFIMGRIARRLWPQQDEVVRHAPFILLGTLFFALSASLALPDMLLMFLTLLAMWPLLSMWRGQSRHAWFLLGMALGIGLLVGGPLILIYVLPSALLAPFWGRTEAHLRWRHWYRDVIKAVLLACGVYACWLVPTALQAGVPFVLAVLLGSLADARTAFIPGIPHWWGYLFLLPFVFLPWSIWPLPWIRLWHIRRQTIDVGLVFCLTWLASAIPILSLLETKSPQFLLPVLPAGALIVSYLLFHKSLHHYAQEHPLTGMALPIILLGCLLAMLPKLPQIEFMPSLLWELSPFIGVGVVGVGIALAWLPWRQIEQRARDIVVVGVLLVVFVILGVASQFDSLYRVDAPARHLAAAQKQHRPIAHVGNYQGQFHFAGRLQQPLVVINSAEVNSWLAWHPQGLLVTYTNAWQPRVMANAAPSFDAPYHDHRIRVWPAAAVLPGVP